MAYYTALINEWATITAANPSFTTAQKLAAINALTVSNVPLTVWHATNQQIFECIVFSEFTGLSQANRMEIWAMLSGDFPKLGGATSALSQIVVIMTSSACPLTYANFVGLSQLIAGTSPWWQANGYPAAISIGDLAAAGNLT